jgi:hypothetical protein
LDLGSDARKRPFLFFTHGLRRIKHARRECEGAGGAEGQARKGEIVLHFERLCKEIRQWWGWSHEVTEKCKCLDFLGKHWWDGPYLWWYGACWFEVCFWSGVTSTTFH